MGNIRPLFTLAVLCGLAFQSCTKDIQLKDDSGQSLPGNSGAVALTLDIVTEQTKAAQVASADTIGHNVSGDFSLTATTSDWDSPLVGQVETKGTPVTGVSGMTGKSIRFSLLRNVSGTYYRDYSNRLITYDNGKGKFVTNDAYRLIGPVSYQFRMVWPSDAGSFDSNDKFTFSPSSTVANQIDLLYCVKDYSLGSGESVPNPMTLTFSHALCQVKVRTDSNCPGVTIKGVSFSGVYSSGTFDGSTGNFTLGSNKATYSLGNVSISAGAGQLTDITSGNRAFLLLPQTVPLGAKITVNFEYQGEAHTLEADITGHNWAKGKTVTYTLNLANAAISISWDKDVYATDPRHGVDSEVIYKEGGSRVFGKGATPGSQGTKWKVIPPSNLAHSTTSSRNYLDYTYNASYDSFMWTPTKYAPAGDYTIVCQTNDGKISDSATLRVNDTRWINTDRVTTDSDDEPITRVQIVDYQWDARPKGWKIPFAWGDRSNNDSNDKTGISPNNYYYEGVKVDKNYRNYITYELVSYPQGGANDVTVYSFNKDKLTFDIARLAKEGDYKVMFYWLNKDGSRSAISDYAILHIGDPIAVTRITGEDITVQVGETKQIIYNVLPENATDKQVIFKYWDAFGASDYFELNEITGEVTGKKLMTENHPYESSRNVIIYSHENSNIRHYIKVTVIDPQHEPVITYDYVLYLEGNPVTVAVGETKSVTVTADLYRITYTDGEFTYLDVIEENVEATLYTGQTSRATVSGKTGSAASVYGVSVGSTYLYAKYTYQGQELRSNAQDDILVTVTSGGGGDDDEWGVEGGGSGGGGNEGGEYEQGNN